MGYYADERASATLKTVGDGGWDGTAALRLVHETYDWTGTIATETLFTGLVTAREWSVGEGGMEVCEWELSSMLHGAATSIPGGGLTARKGENALALIRRCLGYTWHPYRIEGGARDYKYSTAVVFDPGASYLSVFHQVCDKARDRLDVDADGVYTFSAYTAPSQRQADFEVDADDERTMLVGPVAMSDASLEKPGRVVVHATKGGSGSDASEVWGVAVAPSGTREHEYVRGFRVDSYHDESELSPFSKASAEKLARQYLAEELAEPRKASHRLRYMPLKAGMVELLSWAGERLRWQVSSAELDFDSWVWDLELKGGWQ